MASRKIRTVPQTSVSETIVKSIIGKEPKVIPDIEQIFAEVQKAIAEIRSIIKRIERLEKKIGIRDGRS